MSRRNLSPAICIWTIAPRKALELPKTSWWSAMDSNHQFGLPYHAVAIPASLKTHNNFNAHSARRTLWCRSHSPKELPASRVDKWHNDRSLPRHPNVLPQGQKLRDAVDLVVMATDSGTRAFRSGIRHARW